MSLNYYEIMEIPTDADAREIKRAYHRLARELHPDKASNPDEAKLLEEKFALVSAAYNILKDPIKRGEYDRGTVKAPKGPAVNRVLNAGRGGTGGTGPQVASSHSSPGPQPPKPAQGLTPERIAIAQKAFARGMQHFKEDNLPKAISFFEAAIQNNDQEAIYHSRLAQALIREKRSATRAIDAAQKAIDLDPYNLEHKFTLAGVYETIGSKTNAKRIYEEILRWESDNQRAKLALQGMTKKRAPFGLGSRNSDSGESQRGSSESFLQKLMGRFKK